MLEECVVTIDPYLTGMKIAIAAKKRGLKCVAVTAWKSAPQFMKNTFDGSVS